MESPQPKIDEKGYLEIRTLREQTYMFIRTNPGYHRGGYAYSVSKVTFLLSGKGVYIWRDATGHVVEEPLVPQALLEIPADIPHMFYFETESYLLELFAADYSKEPDLDFQQIKNARDN